jgi:hypothetical protein
MLRARVNGVTHTGTQCYGLGGAMLRANENNTTVRAHGVTYREGEKKTEHSEINPSDHGLHKCVPQC